MKTYWCHFEDGVLVSLHQKAGANLRIFHKMRIYTNDIQYHSAYLHKYWFNLKKLHGNSIWHLQIVLQTTVHLFTSRSYEIFVP